MLSIEKAAEALGMTVPALRARIQRAPKKKTSQGTVATLDSAVIAVMPPLQRKWLVQITPPKRPFRPIYSSQDLMHTHEHTLLAKLGFKDHDKGNSRHDLACQYLANERMYKLWDDIPEIDVARYGFCEQVVCKGDGKYKTTVGFLDVWGAFEEEGARMATNGIALEVKIKPVSIGEVLRQINTYREFQVEGEFCTYPLKQARWALVTDYDLTSTDQAVLKRQDILHVRLGPKFDKWIKSQGGVTPSREI